MFSGTVLVSGFSLCRPLSEVNSFSLYNTCSSSAPHTAHVTIIWQERNTPTTPTTTPALHLALEILEAGGGGTYIREREKYIWVIMNDDNNDKDGDNNDDDVDYSVPVLTPVSVSFSA